MPNLRFVVYSKREGIFDRLKEECPTHSFSTPDEGAGPGDFAIVDGGVSPLPAGYVGYLILYDDNSFPPDRKSGEFRVRYRDFVASACEYLCWCQEVAEDRLRIRTLEQEVTFSRQVGELLTSADIENSGEQIANSLLDVLDVPHGTLLLHDPERERFVNLYSNDPSWEETGEFLPGVPVEMLSGSDRWAMTPDFVDGQSLVVIPAHVGEDLIAVFRSVVPLDRELSSVELGNAVHYLEAMTVVLANFHRLTRSNDLAMRDDLTRAFNRRFFESYLDQEVERAQRYGSDFSIIFLDLDDLKEVNSKYGHLMGSRTLQEVAKRVLGAVRNIDRVVRFGGDEFCIILPQTDDKKAEAVAERVRSAICSDRFQLGAGVVVDITASFGIATYPKHAGSKEDLIRAADKAMYKVKVASKNAIKVAEIPA